jgi:hypothetical protein
VWLQLTVHLRQRHEQRDRSGNDARATTVTTNGGGFNSSMSAGTVTLATRLLMGPQSTCDSCLAFSKQEALSFLQRRSVAVTDQSKTFTQSHPQIAQILPV